MRAAGREVANLKPTRWRGKLPTAPRSKRLASAVHHTRTQWAGLDTDIHDASAQNAPNVLLYFHGGGYGICSPSTHRALIARLTREARCKTYAPRYRLAPEHPFPAALEDAQRAYEQHLAEGIAPESIAIAGDSAGGGLALAMLMILRDEGEPLPAGALLLSPWVDLSQSGSSMQDNRKTDYLHPRALEAFAARYAQDADRRDFRLSPLFGDPTGLPALCVQAGGAEVLYSQIEAFAQKAKDAGVPTRFEVVPEMMHVWQGFGGLVPQGRPAVESGGRFLRSCWHIEER
jgi:acetyl esterase/lipase